MRLRDAIQLQWLSPTQEQWNDWYRRILIKDLRCGTGAKLINKVQKDTIPLFGCMLAHDGAKHPKKIAGECYVEYKYDGVPSLLLYKMVVQHCIHVTANC